MGDAPIPPIVGLLPHYGFWAVLPALGTFLGGIALPTSGAFATLGISALNGQYLGVAAGCAVGAAIGDFFLHLFSGNLTSFRVTAMRMGMDFLYAGFFSLIAMLGLGIIPGINPVTGQYVAAGVAGAGVYFMGRYGA